LFQADINALLDVIEEPDAVLKQAIREMQETLDAKRGRLTRNEKNIESLKSNELQLVERIAQLSDDLDLCLKEGSEELARKTIGRKLSSEKYLKAVKRRISKMEHLREQQVREVEVQQDQLESVMEKAEFYVSTAATDSPFSVAESILTPPDAAGGPHVSEEEIELEWMRIKEGDKS
jgi:phage shock protein A